MAPATEDVAQQVHDARTFIDFKLTEYKHILDLAASADHSNGQECGQYVVVPHSYSVASLPSPQYFDSYEKAQEEWVALIKTEDLTANIMASAIPVHSLIANREPYCEEKLPDLLAFIDLDHTYSLQQSIKRTISNTVEAALSSPDEAPMVWLDKDWDFQSIEGNVYWTWDGFSGSKTKSPRELIARDALALEQQLWTRHPRFSASSLRAFWSSWQTENYFYRFCIRLKEYLEAERPGNRVRRRIRTNSQRAGNASRLRGDLPAEPRVNGGVNHKASEDARPAITTEAAGGSGAGRNQPELAAPAEVREASAPTESAATAKPEPANQPEAPESTPITQQAQTAPNGAGSKNPRGPRPDDDGHRRVAEILPTDWEKNLKHSLELLASPPDGGSCVTPSLAWKKKYEIQSYAEAFEMIGTPELQKHVARRYGIGKKLLQSQSS